MKHIEIILVWIPGHLGIKGNENADSMAKNAISSNLADLKHYNIQIYDLLHSSKPDMLKSWQVNWSDSSKRKGRTYASSQPIIPLKP